MIAPLIFASVVQGFAGTGDMKKVGPHRLEGPALFRGSSRPFALFIGFAGGQRAATRRGP